MRDHVSAEALGGEPPVVEAVAETPDERPVPVPVETATSNYLRHLASPLEKAVLHPSVLVLRSLLWGKATGSISCKALAGTVNGLLCPDCKYPVVFEEVLANRKGIVSR